MRQHVRKHAFKAVVIALCQYEVTAILSGKTPTLTALGKQHKWLPYLIVGGLAVHFYRSK